MIRSLVAITLLLALGACSSDRIRKQEERHEAAVKKETRAAEFDGHCGMNLCLKKQKVKCNPEINLDYKGKLYCFSDQKSKDEFVKNIEYNLRSANDSWIIMGPR